MTKNTVEVAFNLHDRVWIADLERLGRIISIWITKTGVQYEVRYFDNAEIKTVYFYEEELTRG